MNERGLQTGREWLACPSCDALHQRPDNPHQADGLCGACGHKLFAHNPNSLQRTLAFSLGGLVLFIPANIYPLVAVSSYGIKNQNDLISGPFDLLHYHMPGIALLVFLTSVVFPLVFMLGMAAVTGSSLMGRYPAWFPKRLRLTQMLNRWAMIDVYLLACLVTFVKLADLAEVDPGVGLYCLGGVLIFTVMASISFDPTLLWDRYARHKQGGRQ
ncbi:paraquat-inducible protein A [Cerasicoccus fimbriatus]|uniref:paraquat-inducible protein A n=1 Tax=Cerasicoccus fimbriatus TaxID=3014554 RepID=UPI0022B32D4F|nr:paraquat-inducible protein A [Cerasicoccus sp. TK19100]